MGPAGVHTGCHRGCVSLAQCMARVHPCRARRRTRARHGPDRTSRWCYTAHQASLPFVVNGAWQSTLRGLEMSENH